MCVLLSLFSNTEAGTGPSTTRAQAFLSAHEYHHFGHSTISNPLTVPAVCINGCSFQGSGKLFSGIDAASSSSNKHKPGEHLYRFTGTSIYPFSQEIARRYLSLKVMRI
jgi:hypothetical protein